jgi:hypothetical protein
VKELEVEKENNESRESNVKTIKFHRKLIVVCISLILLTTILCDIYNWILIVNME